jgi:hypothetical protein
MMDEIELVRQMGVVPDADDAAYVWAREVFLARLPAAEPVKTSPKSRWRRPAIIGALLAGTVGVGAGVAAATGALSPSAISANVGQALAPAQSIVGSVDPLAVPGTVLRVTAAGPEGTVLTVFSHNGNANNLAAGSCETLTLTNPNGSPAPGSSHADTGGCDVAFAGSLAEPLSASQQGQALVGPLSQTAEWSSPTGQIYTIQFGQAPLGTTMVALANADGNVASQVQVVNGWYVTYLTSSDFTTFDNLEFLNPAGQVISTQQLRG